MREYRHRIMVEWLAATEARLWDLDLTARKQKELKENPVGHGGGMIQRVDKYLAQQHWKEPPQALGPVPSPPMFPDRTATLDDYLSAREPSEFEYDSEETDPRECEDDLEEDDTSISSDLTYESNGHDSDWTRRTNISNHNHRRNQRKRKEHRFRHPTNAKKEEDRHKGKTVLSLFRDSPKEGTLTYTDWRREVEEYLRKGYDNNRVKDAMLSSVEGQAYVNFHSCDEGRNRTPTHILRKMDSIYNVSVTFRDLNALMCGIKQGMNEPIKSYYEWMVDISVKLEQYHGDCFSPGELSLMKKDCFYTRLKEHNKYLVSHMKDHDQYGLAQMLKEIREQEDSHYPANTMPKPHNRDNHNKNVNHYGGKGPTYDKTRMYAIRHTEVHLPEPEQEEPDSPPVSEFDPGEMYDKGYYMAVITMADEAEWLGLCFNCGKEGHHWAECTEPLKDSLKRAKERANQKRQSLNQDGGQGSLAPPDGYSQGWSGPGQKLTNPWLTPSTFWNEDPWNRWFDSSNLGTAMIDGVKTTCLIDNGARVNLVTPEFVKNRGLEVGLIQDLNDHDGYIPLSGLGGKITEPLGYVIPAGTDTVRAKLWWGPSSSGSIRG